MVTTQFYIYSDDIDSLNEISEQIIERFKMDSMKKMNGYIKINYE